MDTLVAKLEALLGADAILTGEAAKERGFSLWTRVGAPRAVARPRTTEEVAGVLKLARAEGVAVVALGRPDRPGRRRGGRGRAGARWSG